MSLTNLSLAGVMHTKQCAMLHQLVASDVVVEQHAVVAEASLQIMLEAMACYAMMYER